jgi:hypothetical protein
MAYLVAAYDLHAYQSRFLGESLGTPSLRLGLYLYLLSIYLLLLRLDLIYLSRGLIGEQR